MIIVRIRIRIRIRTIRIRKTAIVTSSYNPSPHLYRHAHVRTREHMDAPACMNVRMHRYTRTWMREHAQTHKHTDACTCKYNGKTVGDRTVGIPPFYSRIAFASFTGCHPQKEGTNQLKVARSAWYGHNPRSSSGAAMFEKSQMPGVNLPCCTDAGFAFIAIITDTYSSRP